MIDTIMHYIYDSLLDDWNLPHWDKQTATELGFTLAFITRMAHTEDEVTLASRNLKWSF
jgi:hypothetical protein